MYRTLTVKGRKIKMAGLTYTSNQMKPKRGLHLGNVLLICAAFLLISIGILVADNLSQQIQRTASQPASFDVIVQAADVATAVSAVKVATPGVAVTPGRATTFGTKVLLIWRMRQSASTSGLRKNEATGHSP